VTMPPDPIALLRSRSYLALLVLAAIIGVPISAAAYFFLALVSNLQERIFTDLPNGLAIAFAVATGKSSAEVLFSGQSALGPLITRSADYTAAALLLLIACKGLAYATSLSGFRGGPVFPSMFIGAAGGMALSHLPGLSLVPGIAMGIGAMCAVMLRLPMTSVLLATLMLSSDGLAVMPLAIVAVVVAYVTSARLMPAPVTGPGPAPGRPRPAARPASPGTPGRSAPR
jgi:H+/Cl- antiporter ClcA